MQQNDMLLIVAASGCCWAGLGTGIYATVSNNWIKFNSSSYSGLWNECVLGTCSGIDPLNWIQAARALMIIMNCFNLIGGILIVTAGCINKRNIFAVAGGLFAFAGLSGSIAASIYTGYMEQEDIKFEYDNGFYNAWVSSGLLFISNLLLCFANQRFNSETKCRQTTNKNVVELGQKCT